MNWPNSVRVQWIWTALKSVNNKRQKFNQYEHITQMTNEQVSKYIKQYQQSWDRKTKEMGRLLFQPLSLKSNQDHVT
jgi:hypothetical protein